MYTDISIYGKESSLGIAEEITDTKAISNALIMFLTLKKGELLYNSQEGGILDDFLFKILTKQTLENISRDLYTEITNFFYPSIVVEDIALTPDKVKKLLKIEISYFTNLTNDRDQVTFYTEGNFEQASTTYIDVSYTGKNLVTFCKSKKPSLQNARLILDEEENSWVYDIYKFINLTFEDIHFGEILQICNGD